MVEGEVGAAEGFEQQIAVERAAGVATPPCTLDANKCERRLEPADDGRQAAPLICRP